MVVVYVARGEQFQMVSWSHHFLTRGVSGTRTAKLSKKNRSLVDGAADEGNLGPQGTAAASPADCLFRQLVAE